MIIKTNIKGKNMNLEKKADLWNQLLNAFEKKSNDKEPEEIYKIAIDLMAELPHFNWTGIYWLNDNGMLELFPYYVGNKTEHVLIPIGKGVCGTAVAENRNIVVKDVRILDNYLACSLETRSEIVILIKDDNGTILGQIDIDSDLVSAFDELDKKNMEILAQKLAKQKIRTNKIT